MRTSYLVLITVAAALAALLLRAALGHALADALRPSPPDEPLLYLDENFTLQGTCVRNSTGSQVRETLYSHNGVNLGYCFSRIGPGSSGDRGYCSNNRIGRQACFAGGVFPNCTGSHSGWVKRYRCMYPPYPRHMLLWRRFLYWFFE